MAFVLPELVFKKTDLEPIVSKETIEFHYGKHHQTYINNLNALILDTEFENMPIEEIIKSSDPGPLFNNAAQSYNHAFYWNCLISKNSKDNTPTIDFLNQISNDFGSFDSFKEQFSDAAMKHFGSGWVWLVKSSSDKLEIKSLHDANNPLKEGDIPLLTIDVWEHAYYIDYRNNRAEYVGKFWQIVNWNFVEKQSEGLELGSILPNSI